jgi:RNA polymerase sigma-70 factor (ECF subfamily)
MTDWPEIVREHGPAVWRTAFRLLGNRADADECFQETFAGALAASRESAEPIQSWGGLLVRLATARGIDRLRQRVRRTSREGGDPAHAIDASRESRPHDAAERSELSERLRLALSHLPSKQADAFCLHCLEGWSYREAAEQMDVTVDHVGVLVHRARAALRQRIDEILSDPEATTGPATTRGASRSDARNASEVTREP